MRLIDSARYFTACFLLLIACLALPGHELRAENAVPASASLVSAEAVNARLQEVEASSDLDENTKAALVTSLQRVLANLQSIEANAELTEKYLQSITAAPEETRELKAWMDDKQRTEPVRTNANSNTPFEEVERELLQEKANLAAVSGKLADIQSQLDSQAGRPNAIRQRLIEARKRQADLESELKLSPPAGETAWLTEARRWSQVTGIEALKSESRMLDQELLSHPVRLALLQARAQQAAMSKKRIEERTHLLEELRSKQGRAETRELQERVAGFDAEGKHELIDAFARRNLELSSDLDARVRAYRRIASRSEDINRMAVQIEEHYRAAREKLEVAGMGEILGEVLRKQKISLPDQRKLLQRLRRHESEHVKVALRQLQENEEYRKLRERDAYLEELTSSLAPGEAELMEDDLDELLATRLLLLENAMASDATYKRTLGEIEVAYQRLYDATRSYNDFLAANLLWIRSAPVPGKHDLEVMPGQLATLLSPAGWSRVFLHLFEGLVASPGYVLMLLVSGGLLWKRRRLRALLIELGRKVGKPSLDDFSYTLKATGVTALLAFPLPLLLFAAGWELSGVDSPQEFVPGVSRGLLWLAPFLFYLRFFSNMCASKGVAESHFGWPADVTGKLRREFAFLEMSFPPVVLVLSVLTAQEQAEIGAGVLRLGMVLLLLLLAMFFYRLSRLMVDFFTRSARLVRQLWVVITVMVPLLLAIITLLGYAYTAVALTKSLIATLWFVFALVLFHQLVVRWLLLTQRRLALKAVRDRIRAAMEKKGRDEVQEEEGSLAEFEESEIDLVALSTESRKLLNTLLVIIGITGFWLIWKDILPAFGILDEVTLWHQATVVAGEQKIVPVTLADIGLAILIAITTLVATQRLPALLEIILLQRFRMNSANRYTVTTLTTYVIVAVGILLFFNTIGADWSKLKWLFAALGVGIGFGLQEIVANFISGLIILFERPIRVGDVVTVGDTSGVVTRIRIRATTIRNWDRQELLVPNKEFITNQLLNWSLSDQTTRIRVPVGVAYGSDVQKAMALMDEAARENEYVLQDPKPSIIFESFGDNALHLELRCFVAEQDQRLVTITQLHQAINDKFSKAGIIIAFPQRDVHLDTSSPLEVRIRKDGE